MLSRASATDPQFHSGQSTTGSKAPSSYLGPHVVLSYPLSAIIRLTRAVQQAAPEAIRNDSSHFRALYKLRDLGFILFVDSLSTIETMREDNIPDDYFEIDELLNEYQQHVQSGPQQMPVQVENWLDSILDATRSPTYHSHFLHSDEPIPEAEMLQQLAGSAAAVNWLDSILDATRSPTDHSHFLHSDEPITEAEMPHQLAGSTAAVYWLESMPLSARPILQSTSPLINGRLGRFVHFLRDLLEVSNSAIYWLDRGTKIFKVCDV
jgi:hypothetical protein